MSQSSILSRFESIISNSECKDTEISIVVNILFNVTIDAAIKSAITNNTQGIKKGYNGLIEITQDPVLVRYLKTIPANVPKNVATHTAYFNFNTLDIIIKKLQFINSFFINMSMENIDIKNIGEIYKIRNITEDFIKKINDAVSKIRIVIDIFRKEISYRIYIYSYFKCIIQSMINTKQDIIKTKTITIPSLVQNCTTNNIVNRDLVTITGVNCPTHTDQCDKNLIYVKIILEILTTIYNAKNNIMDNPILTRIKLDKFDNIITHMLNDNLYNTIDDDTKDVLCKIKYIQSKIYDNVDKKKEFEELRIFYVVQEYVPPQNVPTQYLQTLTNLGLNNLGGSSNCPNRSKKSNRLGSSNCPNRSKKSHRSMSLHKLSMMRRGGKRKSKKKRH